MKYYTAVGFPILFTLAVEQISIISSMLCDPFHMFFSVNLHVYFCGRFFSKPREAFRLVILNILQNVDE